jgi:hypothetical protein
MSSGNFLETFAAELAVKVLVVIIQAVGTSDFTQDVIHALYTRGKRRGFLAALSSALPSLWQALRQRLKGSISQQPFRGVEWAKVLAAAGGSYDTACGSPLDRPHFFVKGAKGLGGYPVLSAAAAGYDRTSGRFLAAIPMHCGGTAGVTHVNVFAATAENPVFVAQIRQSAKESVFFQGRRAPRRKCRLGER